MIKNTLSLDKFAAPLLWILMAIILASFFNTPLLLTIEKINIFDSLLINADTHNILTTNMVPNNQPPFLSWVISSALSLTNMSLASLKVIPLLTFILLIAINYMFILRQTSEKSFAIIVSIVIGTSLFFITASKIISVDLLYILIYLTTMYIFISNVYTNTYSNTATLIAGILTAMSFSLTGFVGSLPILINFLIINFVRGGFCINMKFNNPLYFIAGFIVISIIWVKSLSNSSGMESSIATLFSYSFIDNFSDFKFKENELFRYLVFFIIGGFPWAFLLPSAIFRTLTLLPKRLNTNCFKTAIPLICLINILFLTFYFLVIEKELYIFLTIYLCSAILIGYRIYHARIQKISIINIFFAAGCLLAMILFINGFLENPLTHYAFDDKVKELIIKDNITSGISEMALYLFAFISVCTVSSALVFGLRQNENFLILTIAFSFAMLVINMFLIFPHIQNNRLNKSDSFKVWADQSFDSADKSAFVFYKIKKPTIAQKAEKSFYFDNAALLKNYLKVSTEQSIVLFFNYKQRLDLNISRSKAKCFRSVCYIKLNNNNLNTQDRR